MTIKMPRNLMTAVSVVAFAVMLHGCGGGGGDSPVTMMDDSLDMSAPMLAGKIIPSGTEFDVELVDAILPAPMGEFLVPGLGTFECLDAEGCTLTVAANVLTTSGEIKIVALLPDLDEEIVTALDAVATDAPPEDPAAAAKAATDKALAIAKVILMPAMLSADNSLPASVTATRATSGAPKITLMNTAEDNGVDAFDPAYASVADATTTEIAKWSGDTQMRGGGTLPVDLVTVYTDIKTATPKKFESDSVPTPAGDSVVVLDDNKMAYTGHADEEEQQQSVTGTYNGIPGTFTCIIQNCTATFSELSSAAPNTATTFEGWSFTSTDFVETSATPDGDYLYYGYWLQTPVEADGDHAFQTFSGGSMEFVADNTSAFIGALTGSATYTGAAAGRYVMKELELKDGKIEPASAIHGQFVATAKLTANFGGGDIGTNNQFMVSGTVTDFKDGDTDLGFKVKLERADFKEVDDAFTNTFNNTFNGSASATLGTTESTTGMWNGAFFGPIGEDIADSGVNEVTTTLPTGVAGEFEAHLPTAHLAGGFGATR